MQRSKVIHMTNPWEEIRLEDYENHMSLESVMQLQTMNTMMKEQFEAYPVSTAMVLGVAGGNGLEHISTDKYRTVYGVDINANYLRIVSERYPALSGVLQCLQLDLIQDYEKLPKAELVVANLLIEYIGYKVFQNVILRVAPDYVSCAIQINTDKESWVSDSPYLHVFDRLDEIHHQMEETALSAAMRQIAYVPVLRVLSALPNGKALLRLDYEKRINR